MTNKDNIVKTVVDIGNGYIKAILGEMPEDGEWMRVIKYIEIPSSGIKKSVVENTTILGSAIGAALDKLRNEVVGYTIEKITIGISGRNVKDKRATIVYDFPEKEITSEEIRAFYRKAENEMLDVHEKLLHREMYNTRVNNSGTVKNPQGIKGSQIKSEVYMIYIDDDELDKYEEAVNKAGVEIERIVFSPYAAAKALFQPGSDDRQKGVALVDIGEGSMDIIFYKIGKLIYTTSIAVGAMHYVSDLVFLLYNSNNKIQMTTDDAKEVLDKYLKKEISADNKIYVKDRVTCAEKDVKAIINARTADIARMIDEVIKNSGFDGYLGRGIVITGGATIVDGLADKINEKTGYKVRKVVPEPIRGLETVNEKMAVVIGLISEVMEKEYNKVQRRLEREAKENKEETIERIKKTEDIKDISGNIDAKIADGVQQDDREGRDFVSEMKKEREKKEQETTPISDHINDDIAEDDLGKMFEGYKEDVPDEFEEKKSKKHSEIFIKIKKYIDNFL